VFGKVTVQVEIGKLETRISVKVLDGDPELAAVLSAVNQWLWQPLAQRCPC